MLYDAGPLPLVKPLREVSQLASKNIFLAGSVASVPEIDFFYYFAVMFELY